MKYEQIEEWEKGMVAKIIDGKAMAEKIRGNLIIQTQRLESSHNIIPGLAVILVGDNPASQVYVRNKVRQTTEVGMKSFEYRFEIDVSEEELLTLIATLNADEAIHGILVQLPLPSHLNAEAIINAIAPQKDVDGFHILNAGRLASGQKAMIPCTPLGCRLLLHEHYGSLAGLHAVVLGRSGIVGKPMAQLLLQDNCTVTIAHSHTKGLDEIIGLGDIVIAAVGRAQMVQGAWLKRGATVIDVGINRIAAPERGKGKTRLVGDCDFDSCIEIAGAITPVPGGVGPMTIACLLANTLTACCRIHGLDEPGRLAI